MRWISSDAPTSRRYDATREDKFGMTALISERIRSIIGCGLWLVFDVPGMAIPSLCSVAPLYADDILVVKQDKKGFCVMKYNIYATI